MNRLQIHVRNLFKDESAFLREMTYQSVFVPEGEPPAPKDIVDQPLLLIYYEEWGRIGDHCLVAEYKGNKIGAVWCRLYNENNKGFGFVSEDIPELSIAVCRHYRNKGIGTMLLTAFYKHLKEAGFTLHGWKMAILWLCHVNALISDARCPGWMRRKSLSVLAIHRRLTLLEKCLNLRQQEILTGIT